MARGKTLEHLLTRVRAEARLSLAPSANIQVRDSHIVLIQREQERLWEDFNWPHLQVQPKITLAAGQHRYSLPEGVSIDRVLAVHVKDGGEWRPLRPEITDEDYRLYDTDTDQRSWPVRAWRANADDDIEVWPIPEQSADPSSGDGQLRVTAIRNLKPLVSDSDRADLDDQLLILYAAGGLLAAAQAADAQLKIEAANRLYMKLKGKQTKSSSFNLFGVNKSPRRRFGPPRQYMTR